MQTTAFIKVVKTVFNMAKPVVVFELTNGITVFRYPKQALIDMQNSGRALDIHATALDRGLDGLNAVDRQNYITALLDCTNAQLTGDIITYKAGDEYEITAQHPSITDKTHPDFGKVKVGDKKQAEKDGNRVEGFLFIPLTEAEKMRRSVSVNIAQAMMQMYGLGSVPAPIAMHTPVETTVSTTLGNTEDAFEDLPTVPTTTADKAGVK